MSDFTASSSRASPSPAGLAGIAGVTLSADLQSRLDHAAAGSSGTAVWTGRKLAEAKDLLALSQIAPQGRLHVDFLDLREALRAVVFLRVPVALEPETDIGFTTAARAVLGIHYPQEAIRQPLPGFAFLQVLSPKNVWHANVGRDHGQPLCLGAQLPAGVRVKELILMAYGALSMQTVMIDEQDSAGVLHPEAAVWWQSNLHRLPLSTTPFLGDDDIRGAAEGREQSS